MEGQLAELTHGVLLTGGDDEILRLVVLQNQPHALHIVLGIAPVAQAGQVAQVELILLALRDAGGSQRDLAGDEGLAAALGLVVEQDTEQQNMLYASRYSFTIQKPYCLATA